MMFCFLNIGSILSLTAISVIHCPIYHVSCITEKASCYLYLGASRFESQLGHWVSYDLL